MNIQDIIVFILVVAAVVYTAYNFIQIFVQKSENSCGCSSCDIESDVKELKSIAQKKLH